jgi:SanA protein
MQRIKKLCVILKTVGLIFIALAMVSMLPRLITAIYSQGKIVAAKDVPSNNVAIIFGAGLRYDGTPTEVLKDRVATGADLYFSGKVKKLLMSGDNRFVDYNEPAAMREYAIGLGVPQEDIVLDYAGRRTYDTCYRAKEIFKVDKAILVTQNFHLPRALFICNSLGVDSIGVSADIRVYRASAYRYWELREIPATTVAFVELFISQPLPVLGDPEPIFPDKETAKK